MSCLSINYCEKQIGGWRLCLLNIPNKIEFGQINANYLNEIFNTMNNEFEMESVVRSLK